MIVTIAGILAAGRRAWGDLGLDPVECVAAALDAQRRYAARLREQETTL